MTKDSVSIPNFNILFDLDSPTPGGFCLLPEEPMKHRADEQVFRLHEWSNIKQDWVRTLVPGGGRVRFFYHKDLPLERCYVPVRYVERIREANQRTMLLIFKEKHGTGYYLCRDIDELGAACLSVMRQRREQGWYTSFQVHLQKPVTPLEAINPKDGPLMDACQRQWDNYHRSLKEYQDAKQYEEQADKILEELSLLDAYYFLDERSAHGYEYEKMEVEYPSIVDGKELREEITA